jgi:hypothetical protein
MLRGGVGGVGVGLRRGQRRDNHPKSSAAAQNALQDGQTVILAVRDPINNTPVATSTPSLTTTPIFDAATAPPTSTPATESEASLTAKNYRLAKELVGIDENTSRRDISDVTLILRYLFSVVLQSDIRVRHREEHKNVTRLTMENVSTLVSQSPELQVPDLLILRFLRDRS